MTSLRAAEKIGCGIEHLTGLDRSFPVDFIVKDDIADACIDNQRTIITRYNGTGEKRFLLASSGAVTFDDVKIRPLT